MHYVVVAAVGGEPIETVDGTSVELSTLPFSGRLVVALSDWCEFFAELDGAIGVLEQVDLEEFINQGMRLARRVREELPGTTVDYRDPSTGELVRVTRKTVR